MYNCVQKFTDTHGREGHGNSGSLMISLKSFFSGQDDCTVIFNDFKKLDAQV